MKAAALKAQASRSGLRLRDFYGDDKGFRHCISNESKRANDLQGGAGAFGGKTPEEKPQQTWTMLRLSLYARDLNAMTVNGRKSVVFN